MKTIKYFFFGCCLVLFASCLRLDSQLFNPDNSITEYFLEDYTGDVTFRLDSSYKIEDSLAHLFTLPSSGPNGDASIYALYLGNISEIAEDTVILYLHGNSAHMDQYYERIKLLANVGHKNRFGVLAIDYQGYGMSEGAPSEEGLYNDTEAAISWLSANGLSSDRLVIYGFSMGSAPATELAANPRSLEPSWLVLEAPFASMENMLHDAGALAIPGSWVSNLKIDNAEEIKKVDEPFLWFHGIADDFLTMESHGEVVWKNYSGEKGMAERVEGGGHSTVPNIMGFETYNARVLEFLTGN